ncbi:hypothetical protein, partial [Klebsiella pneumoniae]|uniref:hypothetical protein n=1 Tax=Klebsiella pneumoniae TaxID=573 RepID=UPI001AEF883F
MSAESSGVFTLKEINRIKIIQDVIERRITTRRAAEGTVAKLAMRQPFVLFKGLTFQKLCLPGA